MNSEAHEQLQEKIRQQYEHSPYPHTPIEKSPKDDYSRLFIHNLATSYYLRYRKVTSTEGKVILDAGCGSGYKSLALAEANPGARIISVDLSQASVDLARERLKYHGFDNVEFHVLRIEDLPQLGLTFDYINCDEVLYLVPDALTILKSLQAVLKPEGIIRGNLHNVYQRMSFYRGKALFEMMGLLDEGPKDLEYQAVVETMKALKAGVRLRDETWSSQYEDPKTGPEAVFMNYLLMGDRGFTVPEMFELLSEADLEFISMVNWRHWNIVDLFQDPESLPLLWDMGLANASIEEQLRLYELLHPVHRLMDFWCGHPDQLQEIGLDEWDETDWHNAIVHLHPQLRSAEIKQAFTEEIQRGEAVIISKWISLPTLNPVVLDSISASCLLPLWDESQSMQALVERYLKIQPINPITLEATSETVAFEKVKALLSKLECFLYVLLERS